MSPAARLTLALTLATLSLLALSVPLALAAPPVTIASSGHGAGQVEDPASVALDGSAEPTHGDVYLADRNNFRIDKFSPAGQFLLAWGWGVRDGLSQEAQTCGPEASPPSGSCFAGQGNFNATAPGAVEPNSIAVDPSSGDVYVGEGKSRVQKFTPSGRFLLIFGRGVDQGPHHPGDLCTAAYIAEGDVCGEGEAGAGPGQFGARDLPVAVDPEGHLWVGDTGRLEQFGATGEYLSELAVPGAGEIIGLAIDSSGDFYVNFSAGAASHIDKLGPSGNLIETIDGESGAAIGLDSAGDLYLADDARGNGAYVLKEYNSSGQQLEQFGAGAVIGHPIGSALAPDSSGRLYVASGASAQSESVLQRFPPPEPGPVLVEGSQRVTERGAVAATLTATLDPEGRVTHYRFQYVSEEDFEKEGGFASPHTGETPLAALPASDFGEYLASAHVEGLAPETRYRFRVIAENAAGKIEGQLDGAGHEVPASFEPLPLAEVEAEWITAPSDSAATLHAEVNPNGTASEYVFQYATRAAYEAGGTLESETAPQTFSSPGFEPVKVSARLEGLAPATAYAFRVLVRHGAFHVAGAVRSFSTQPTATPFQLPDGRAWELVSPPGDSVLIAGAYGPREAAYTDFAEAVFQAAVSGDALTYSTREPVTPEPQGNRDFEDSQVLSHHTASGWANGDLTTPYPKQTQVHVGEPEYPMFSADLAAAVVEPHDANPLLSPGAAAFTPYLRDNLASPPTYEGLVAATDLPPGTEFAGAPRYAHPTVVGATPDFAHVVLTSPLALTAHGAPGGLYEWTAGRLADVSILPAAEGGAAIFGELGGGGNGAYGVRNAISADGSRVFWMGHGLDLRDTAGEETIRLDTVQPGASGRGGERPLFQFASADGSRAFFTDTQQLTPDSTAEAGKPDLYECEVLESAGHLSCALTDLTASIQTPGEVAGVQGLVPGGGETGTRLYFVATGALTPPAEENANHEHAQAGQFNLYTAAEEGGAWHTGFIAALSLADAGDWGGAGAKTDELGVLISDTSRSSPNGRYFAFLSHRSLTGSENRDAASGNPDAELYLYDAQAEALSCPSCDPTGARPAGSATVPVWSKIGGSAQAFRQPAYLSDSGRLFFESPDALVPQDVNSAVDLYEYEPSGAGSCSTAPGCVSLISSGTSPLESRFIDASASGNDVFFESAASLTGQPATGTVRIYDAHVCGSGWSCEPPPQPERICETIASCGPPSEQSNGAVTPGSGHFEGPSEGPGHPEKPLACKKGKVKKHGKCVKRPKPHKRHRHHRRARRVNRRAPR